MSLLGVDVGTTGCKACVFTERGVALGSSYVEYPETVYAGSRTELVPERVLDVVKGVVRSAVNEANATNSRDPVSALSVASMGEAFVLLSGSGDVLGTSLTGADPRGEEYLEPLSALIPNERLQ